MGFEVPLALLGLVALGAAAVAYAAAQRRQRRAAGRFANTALLPSVAPVRPGWRRHVPLALHALALGLLIAAVARPHATLAVPVEQASIVLATDISGSMQATDVAPSRLLAARQAAERFVEDVPRRVRVGVLAFNHRPRGLQRPTLDREPVLAALSQLRPSGGTATGDALTAALALLDRPSGTAGERRAPGAIVLLSDGASTSGSDPLAVARRAGRLRTPIYTVTVGTAAGTIRVAGRGGSSQIRPVPPDPASLRRIARLSGGRAFTAADGGELATVYERLGSRLGRRQERREVSAAFVGGALALLAAGAALSLRWFGRLL